MVEINGKIVGGPGNGPGSPIGSYGSWTFGRGSAYAELAVPLGVARFVPAMVTLPPGQTLQAMTERRDVPVQVLLPELWQGVRRRDGVATSWPVVLDFGDPRERPPLDAALISKILAALGTGAPGTAPATFSLGAPMPPSIVSPFVLPAPAPIDPDPSVVTQLQKGNARLTVMAVIDDGIPFAHRNLMNKAGDSTRVEYCWLQSATADGELRIGKHFTRGDINALRATHGPDEDAIYHRAGALDAIANAPVTLAYGASHGAHVIDAAAGLRGDTSAIDLMRVIAVQLPAPFTIDTTGFKKQGAVLAAMHAIFSRADAIAAAYLGDADAPMPLVINFSYGFTGGPHDGSDPLEIDMAQLVADRIAAGKPTELVMPAGNSFADRMLGEITPEQLSGGEVFDIPWRLQPNDATPSYLEIWVPSAGGSTYGLSIVDPQGRPVDAAATLAFKAGVTSVKADLSIAGRPTGEISIQSYNTTWTLVLVALAPTEPRDTALPSAPSGCWTISLTLTAGAAPERPIACRIQRDNDPFGYRRGGRQSYLDDPDDIRFSKDGALSRTENPESAFVRRFGTVNGIATHDRVTVVTSYFADTGRATAYASAGASGASVGGPGTVDYAMPADTSTALPGSLAAGTRSGSSVRLSGTSMAAPLYARRLGLQFIDNQAVTLQPNALKIAVSTAEVTERPARLGVVIA